MMMMILHADGGRGKARYDEGSFAEAVVALAPKDLLSTLVSRAKSTDGVSMRYGVTRDVLREIDDELNKVSIIDNQQQVL